MFISTSALQSKIGQLPVFATFEINWYSKEAFAEEHFIWATELDAVYLKIGKRGKYLVNRGAET